ncbi:YndM family protein [Bacillaceae bacterium W0354]
MNHLKSIVVKFVACLALLYLILGIGYDFSFLTVFWFTVVLGTVSYIIGDLLILPRTNNTIATFSDFVLAFVLLYYLINAAQVEPFNVFTAALITSIGVAVFEFFFHKYIESNTYERDISDRRRRYEYQTEFSEELNPDDFEE